MKKGIMNSKVMDIFTDEMEKQIGSAFKIANDEDKEVELTIKMNIGILAKWKAVEKSDAGMESMIQPEMDFKVTRKVKETKVASEGIISDAELRFDEDGNPYLVKAKSDQMDMDDWAEQQEDIINTTATEVEQKVIAFKSEAEQVKEESDRIDQEIIDVDYSEELGTDLEDDFFKGGANEE